MASNSNAEPRSKPLNSGKGIYTPGELYRGSWTLSDASRGIYEWSPSFGQPRTGTNGHPRTVIRTVAYRETNG
jgi:hypothetical protein